MSSGETWDGALTAFRQWGGLVSGDHDHLAECQDTYIADAKWPDGWPRPRFSIRCEHGFTAEFEPVTPISS